jgi:DNA-binding PadR family transcriptional regulator
MVVGLEEEISMKIHERILKTFLDFLILGQLRKEPKSAYDIIALIQGKFSILMSPGTIYSGIYSLERDRLIKGNRSSRKRVYVLTDKGKKTMGAILNSNDKIQLFVTNFLSDLGK